MVTDIFIHPTATVSDESEIGIGSKIWNYSQIRESVVIGCYCNIGSYVYVDFDIKIGDKVKIQNHVSLYHRAIIEDGVFIGPHVCFSNDKFPRAITLSGDVKTGEDWESYLVCIREGASIGANSTILPGITVGLFAMVGAGSVVTKNVPDYGLVVGNPARLVGFVCKCGKKVYDGDLKGSALKKCEFCGVEINIGINGDEND